MLAVAVTAAVVVADHVALRASDDRSSAQQAVLWAGDWLEVRGTKRGWLKVYDHRHERAGWVAAQNVKQISVEEASAPAVRAVVDFLRDTPGEESLGIAYAAIYLKVAPKVDPSMLVSLGTMADRLAHRASSAGANAAAAEQIDVARSWGITLASVEQPSGTHICYDGAAFRTAITIGAQPADAATAVLALTEPGCEPTGLGTTELLARDAIRLALIERVDPTQVGGPIGNQLRIRRAEISAQLAWADARRNDLAAAAKHADAAFSAFARVDQTELAAEDAPSYSSAAVAVAASHWAVLPTVAAPGLALKLADGEAGETCISLVPTKGAASETKCTHGQVWASSLRATKNAAVVAVEPLPGWLELWMFRRGADGGWMIDVLAPNTDGPDRGYVELAGFSPDGSGAVLVREARTDGVVRKTYEAITVATLAVSKQSSTLAGLGAAKRWAGPEWKQRTLAQR
ncbi:MAG TPA: hypothetical protein VGM90_15745 [Kofleriaceae bacterium]|jgi:hypothetical protein